MPKHACFFTAVKIMAYKKAQSAMEYLMTYGWAILIIAVVLGALFELGVFDPATLAPKAEPGSCQVYRPYGPGTTTDMNLVGACLNMLPKFVADMNGDGIISTTYVQTSVHAYTITAWIKTTSGSGNPIVQDRGSNSGNSITMEIGYNGGQAAHPGTVNCGLDSADVWIGGFTYVPAIGQPLAFNNGEWHFVACTFDSADGSQITPAAFTVYVDGKQEPLYTQQLGSVTSPVTGLGGTGIGYQQPWNDYFDGEIANIQIYNKSLGQESITTLYDEGVGGDPIELQYLMGWWPLNGNSNDYSGNGNNGQASGVVYTGAWTSGYSGP